MCDYLSVFCIDNSIIEGRDICLDASTILVAEARSERAADAPASQSLLPAGSGVAQIGASPMGFARGIDDHRAIGRAHHANQLALVHDLVAAYARSLRLPLGQGVTPFLLYPVRSLFEIVFVIFIFESLFPGFGIDPIRPTTALALLARYHSPEPLIEFETAVFAAAGSSALVG